MLFEWSGGALQQRGSAMSKSTPAENANESEPIDPELLAQVEAALLTLPRLTREVFLANRIDDLSFAEIAKRTGISKRRVRREMARAIWGFPRAMEGNPLRWRSEEHTSELQSLMRISYAVFCLKKK